MIKKHMKLINNTLEKYLNACIMEIALAMKMEDL